MPAVLAKEPPWRYAVGLFAVFRIDYLIEMRMESYARIICGYFSELSEELRFVSVYATGGQIDSNLR